MGGKVGKKRGNGDWVMGPKVGQLTLSIGPARAEVPATYKEPPFQKEGYLYIKYSESTTQAII
jgi:hypothetical protein